MNAETVSVSASGSSLDPTRLKSADETLDLAVTDRKSSEIEPQILQDEDKH